MTLYDYSGGCRHELNNNVAVGSCLTLLDMLFLLLLVALFTVIARQIV